MKATIIVVSVRGRLHGLWRYLHWKITFLLVDNVDDQLRSILGGLLAIQPVLRPRFYLSGGYKGAVSVQIVKTVATAIATTKVPACVVVRRRTILMLVDKQGIATYEDPLREVAMGYICMGTVLMPTSRTV